MKLKYRNLCSAVQTRDVRIIAAIPSYLGTRHCWIPRAIIRAETFHPRPTPSGTCAITILFALLPFVLVCLSFSAIRSDNSEILSAGDWLSCGGNHKNTRLSFWRKGDDSPTGSMSCSRGTKLRVM